jgi:phage baseplate assembly protein W
LIQEIEEVLKNFEKRIRLSNITINSEEDSNEFNVFIEYYIVGLPQSLQNVEFLLVRES